MAISNITFYDMVYHIYIYIRCEYSTANNTNTCGACVTLGRSESLFRERIDHNTIECTHIPPLRRYTPPPPYRVHPPPIIRTRVHCSVRHDRTLI